MAGTTAKTLHTSLDKLQISPQSTKKPAKPTSEPLDSWDDDAGSDTETETAVPSEDVPGPPPPTPSSPSVSTPNDLAYSTLPAFNPDGSMLSDKTNASQEKRPEKSTAVANRLIAAGIGQKAPKRTKEQREYDQAMKLQEKKKRDAAREAEQRKKAEAEQAKKDIWGD